MCCISDMEIVGRYINSLECGLKMLSDVDIIRSEFLLTLVIASIVLTSVFVKSRYFHHALLFMISVYLLAISMRSDLYNTDTANYHIYFEAVRSQSIIESLLTKIEPVHYVIINISNSFAEWIVIEYLIYLIVLALLMRNKSITTVALIVGCTLPLMSSSFRFAIGLVFCAYTYSIFIKYKNMSILSGLVGGLFHVSLFAAPLITRFSLSLIIFVLIAVGLLSYSPWFIERTSATGDIGLLSLVGVKTIIVAFVQFIYYRICCDKNLFSDWILEMYSYVVGMVVLFVFANMYLQVANRWMILSMVLFAVRSDQAKSHSKANNILESLFGFIMFAMLTFPQVVLIYMNDGWLE